MHVCKYIVIRVLSLTIKSGDGKAYSVHISVMWVYRVQDQQYSYGIY